MFSIARFWEQFMILFRQNKNRHGLILGIFIIIQLFGFVNYFSGTNSKEIDEFYQTAELLSIILSVIACQDVFNKLRSTPSGIQYLMTPGTIIEKYSAAWLYSSIVVFLAAQATFFIVQLLGIGLGNSITGITSGYGLPEWNELWSTFLSVMFTHSVFFFGSLLFRKNPLIKTLGSYIGIVLFFSLAFAWVAKHYLIDSAQSGSDSLNINMNGSLSGSINGVPLSHYLEFIGVNIKWILGGIALLLWSGSYVLLNKKQI